MENKMKTLTYEFKIIDGKFTCEYGSEFEKFKSDNEGRSGDMTLKIIRERNVMYWRHKYYRSVLLPLIAAESFSGDDFEAHIFLKKKYLFVKCELFSEVPAVHKEDRTMFVFGTDDRFRGFIPSTGNLTDDEMHKYLYQIEGLINDIQAGYTDSQREIRQKAMQKDIKKI